MIQYADNQHQSMLMDLWKLCFSDTNDFIRLYFDRVYKKEETLILVENNVLVASLQMIPYSIKTGNEIQPAGYVSGVMTHPDYRKKGHMERLLLAAFEEMKKKGYMLTFLIPQEEWLFGFYKKYGYQKAFPVCFPVTYDCRIAFNEKESTEITAYSNLNDLSIDTLYSLYTTYLSQKKYVVLKTRAQFSIILEDLFLDKGVVFAGKQGIAFACIAKDKVRVKELYTPDEASQRQFLYKIALHYSNKELNVLHTTGITPQSHFSGMIKALHPTAILPDDIYMSMMLD